MSEVVKCLATTKKGSRCSFKAKTGGLCGCHAPPSIQKPKAVKKSKKVSARQLLEENNILLRAIANKIGINVEELLAEKPIVIEEVKEEIKAEEEPNSINEAKEEIKAEEEPIVINEVKEEPIVIDEAKEEIKAEEEPIVINEAKEEIKAEEEPIVMD